MAEALTIEESKSLLQLCRTGRLYEVEKWIGSGKPLRVAKECKKAALLVALEAGFYSLVELIARNEQDQATKNAALRHAVEHRQFDFAPLLLAHGADLKSVDLADVLYTWNSDLMRMFLARGADPITSRPFAQGFAAKIRTALRVYLEFKREHPEISQQLQEQADCALRHFCKEGDVKWASLMLWVRADPRANGPTLDSRYGDDPECFTTAMEEACYAKNAEVLKKLKPTAGRDDLTKLLERAALFSRKDSVDYLLALGANPNDKPNGGSSALDSCMRHFWPEYYCPYRQQRSKYAVSATLACIKSLVEHNAQWKPDNSREMAWLRRELCECEPAVTTEVLQLLVRNNACSHESIQELLRPPRMKAHMEPQAWHLARLKRTLKEPKKKTGREPPPPELLRQFNRQELYEKLWSEPKHTVAKSNGVSDVWLGKVCKALRVPVPGRGYWAKKYAGAPVPKRPALPSIDRKGAAGQAS